MSNIPGREAFFTAWRSAVILISRQLPASGRLPPYVGSQKLTGQLHQTPKIRPVYTTITLLDAAPVSDGAP